MEAPKPKIQTEDLGKQLEMAVCLAMPCPWVGAPYKYGLEAPEALKPRVRKALDHLSFTGTHTAEKGSVHDFSAAEASCFLSCKSTKGDAKVAPQQIGQPSCAKFASFFEGAPTEPAELKIWIQDNTRLVLEGMFKHLFYDKCPVLYYNKKTDKMLAIRLRSVPDWASCELSWTRAADAWTNSSTLKASRPGGGGAAKPVALVEIQFHTTRKNMANRWCFEKLLALFPECFEIQAF